MGLTMSLVKDCNAHVAVIPKCEGEVNSEGVGNSEYADAMVLTLVLTLTARHRREEFSAKRF